MAEAVAAEREVDRGPSPPSAFDVVDLLDGFVRLEKRDRALGGSVPLRAVQGCAPLLEGNAFGLQVSLTRRVTLRRRAFSFAHAIEGGESLRRLLGARWPMAQAHGLLDRASAWSALFRADVVAAGRRLVPLFTGLLVRPREGVVLRLSSLKNRRSFAYDVGEARLDDATRWTPLVLYVEPHVDEVSLVGQVATLAPLPAQVTIRELDVADAPEVVAAHVGFYDGAYFGTKRSGEVARKYRREAPRRASSEDASPARLDLVAARAALTPDLVAPARPTMAHRPMGPERASGPVDRVLVKNAVTLRARFDGLDLPVTPDGTELASFATDVRESLGPAFARAAAAGEPLHEGALLYLTKYVTPHPAGEPHFFVKPPVFVRTPPGVVTLVEGVGTADYDIMRGVVETDRFHATPAVFHLPHVGRAIEVARGAPLAQLFPIPRWLVDASFTVESPAAFQVPARGLA